VTLHKITANDPIRTPVASLDQDIGSERFNRSEGIGLVEDCNVIHAGKSRQNLGPLGLREQRPRETFNLPNRGVAVDRDHKKVSEPPGPLKISEVADMEKIETAVRENDSLSPAMPSSQYRLQPLNGPDLRFEIGGTT